MAKAITREVAAAELSCSVRTIDRLRASGELEEIALGARVRILACSLDALIDRRRHAGPRATATGADGPCVDVTNLRASYLKARKQKTGGRG
jgi:hypothetical protein